MKTSVQKLWKGANCFVMHQISLCSIAHKRHLRSRRRMVYIMLPFSGGKGLGVVLCPFCILLPYSECPERMLSVSIFTQLCYRIFLWNWPTHNLIFRWVLGQDVTLLTKGHSISKCLFGVFNSPNITNQNNSTRGDIVVKLNLFVCFFGRIEGTKTTFLN